MIIHDYDADTQSVVNPEAFFGKKKKLVDKWEQWANTHHVFPKGKGGRDTRLTE